MKVSPGDVSIGLDTGIVSIGYVGDPFISHLITAEGIEPGRKVNSPTIQVGSTDIGLIERVRGNSYVGSPFIDMNVTIRRITKEASYVTSPSIDVQPVDISADPIERSSRTNAPIIAVGDIGFSVKQSIRRVPRVGNPVVEIPDYPIDVNHIEGTSRINSPYISTGSVDVKVSASIKGTSRVYWNFYTDRYISPVTVITTSYVGEPKSVRNYVDVKPQTIPSTARVNVPRIDLEVIVDRIEGKSWVNRPSFEYTVLMPSIPSTAIVRKPIIVNTLIGDKLKRFDVELWEKLHRMEQACYNSNPVDWTGASLDPVAIYEPKFKQLNSAISSWMNRNRNTVIRDYIMSLYSYIVMNAIYGMPTPRINEATAKDIFDINGWIEFIKNQQDDFFADYIEPPPLDPLAPVTEGETKNIDDSIVWINNAYDEGEVQHVESLQDHFIQSVGNFQHKLMFEDLPMLGSLSKDEVAQKIFIDLGYKTVYDVLNIGMEVPDSVKQ